MLNGPCSFDAAFSGLSAEMSVRPSTHEKKKADWTTESILRTARG